MKFIISLLLTLIIVVSASGPPVVAHPLKEKVSTTYTISSPSVDVAHFDYIGPDYRSLRWQMVTVRKHSNVMVKMDFDVSADPGFPEYGYNQGSYYCCDGFGNCRPAKAPPKSQQ